jgi:threonine/homoserine/homoserine lactone efflux protein
MLRTMSLNLTIGPLALFALVASITPGPNNFLLMRSGARFGVRRSTAPMVGIQCGFIGLLLLSHLGVGALLLAWPVAMTVLHWACFFYLLWLATVILRDAHSETRPAVAAPGEAQSAQPMTFFQALSFQLINPKAWMMTVTAVSAFYGGVAPTIMDLAATIVICVTIGTNSMLVWTIWGATIHRLLKEPRARQLFGYSMAVLVVITAFWMLR